MIAVLGTHVRPAEAQATFCFRGNPLEQCRAHLVTEAGIAVTSVDEDPYWTLEAGALLNVAQRSGVGVTALAAVFQNDFRAGFRLRYRHWLPSGFTLDVAPGVLLVNESFVAQGIGFSGGVAVGYRDWAAVTLQLEVADYELEGTQATGFLGFKLGSYPGAVGVVAALVWGIAVAVIAPQTT